jgi:hypothetical protein
VCSQFDGRGDFSEEKRRIQINETWAMIADEYGAKGHDSTV